MRSETIRRKEKKGRFDLENLEMRMTRVCEYIYVLCERECEAGDEKIAGAGEGRGKGKGKINVIQYEYGGCKKSGKKSIYKSKREKNMHMQMGKKGG